jgi:uncharacterized RDD family membrane protein YckC
MANIAATAIAPTVHYAGFWRRFLALIIDSLILGAVFGVLSAVVPFVESKSFSASDDTLNFDIHLTPLGAILTIGGSWLYFALLESSARGATIGKMALAMHVTDLEGRRISFMRATGRYFAKYVSGMIFAIGYIMAAFTARKQALHDMLAGTLVVKPRG